MKKTIVKKLVTLIISSVSICSSYTQTTTSVDDNVLRYMNDNKIPGLSLALIKNGKIALTKGYGLADIEKDIPFTPNTIMSEVASISKTITATAIMKLWEQGAFQLSDPINNYLPFTVVNPNYPSVPITFQMVLTHTSSIAINERSNLIPTIYVSPGTADPLGVFLQNFLVPGGSLYNASKSYMSFVPGTQFAYSNIGYALLGYLVERISGMPFDEYCDQNIFQPLCMNHTSWYFSGVDVNIVAQPYKPSLQEHPYDLYEHQDYPSFQLKTSIIDLSKFLLMHMNFGKLDGVRIIDSTTEVLMRIPQVTAQTTPDFRLDHTLGFFEPYWFGIQKTYLGHDGKDYGVGTGMFANLTDGTGLIIFQNRINLFPAAFPLNFYLDSLVNTISTANMPLLNCSYLLNPCEQNANYWKNNSPLWALSAEKIKLGSKYYYSKNQTLALLNMPVNGDASILLAKSLIAAKLNVAQGSELSPIVLTINSAMNLIGTHRLPYDNPVSFSSETGIQMLALAATLDSYNSGGLNTTACSGSSTIITRSNPINEIDRTALSHSLSVYPNPTNGSANISFYLPESGKVSLTIYDITGKLIKTIANTELNEGGHTFSLDVENFRAGIYLLRLQTGNYLQTKKFIVRH